MCSKSEGAQATVELRQRVPHRLRRATSTAFLIGVAVWLAVMLQDLDLDRVWQNCTEVEAVPLLVALALNLLSQVSRAIAWRLLLDAVPVSFPRLVGYELLAQGASALTPEGTGELIRVRYLRRHGVTDTTTVTLTVVRKVFSTIGLAPLVVVGWIFDELGSSALPAEFTFVMSVYVVAAAVMFVILTWTTRHPTPSGGRFPGWLRRSLAEAQQAMLPLRRLRVSAFLVAGATLTRAMDLTSLLILASAMHLDLSVGVAVLILVAIEVSNVLPTAPGQIGTFESAILFATTGVVAPADAFGLALLFHVQQVVPQVVGGLLLLPILGRDNGRWSMR